MPFNAITGGGAGAASDLSSVADWASLPAPSDGDQAWVRDAGIAVQYIGSISEWVPFGLLNDAQDGLSADLKGWWSASSLTLSDGDDVDSWAGIVGGTFSQNATDPVPTFETSTTSGEPAKFVDFGDHTHDSWLVGDSTADAILDGPLNYAQVFGLFKITSDTDNQPLIRWGGGPSDYSSLGCRAVASPDTQVGNWFHEYDTGSTDYEEHESSTPKIPEGEWGVNGWCLNQTTSALWRGTPSATTGQKLSVETRSSATLFFETNTAAMGRTSNTSTNWSELQVADIVVVIRDFDLRLELAVEIDAWLKARAGV